MISALLLWLAVIGLGIYDRFYRSTFSNRERNRWMGNLTAFLFILVVGWEWSYAYRMEGDADAALIRGFLALLGGGVAFLGRNGRLGKRGAIFYVELVASWIGFSVALVSFKQDGLFLFLGWEWGWFWLIRLIGFHYKIPENRSFRKMMHRIGFLITLCLGLGLYGIVMGWHQKFAIVCFLIGWGFRLGIVPFYFWGFRAVSISPIGIFFTTVVFVVQVILGGIVFSENLIMAQFDADIARSWEGFERGLLFLSGVNLMGATILLFWQRSLRQWLFFLYLFQCGWFLFLVSQRQWGNAIFFCWLAAFINLGLWGVVLKVGQQNEGSDAVAHFIGLVNRHKILGMGFCLLLASLISLLAAQSFIFLSGVTLQKVVAGITFLSLIALFLMLKKIVGRLAT